MNQYVAVEKSRPRVGFILLFAVALLQSAVTLFYLLATGPELHFAGNTGIAWAEFSRANPTVAGEYAMTRYASLAANLAMGLFALAILYFPFRDGRRWAWFTLWILPAYLSLIALNRAQNGNDPALIWMAALLILVAVAGLLISYPAFFRRSV
jgi:hypothetical protein